jgi:plasmid stabilization system protein ParE
VATVVYAARALEQVVRTVDALRDAGPGAAARQLAAIRSAIDHLAAHPLTGRRLAGELRELAISYGPTGSVAVYRFLAARDEVRVLALRPQRGLGAYA